TLHGVITDAYTGKPLPDVLVKASDTISATTGADGSYVLNDVSEQVALTISSARYETLSHTIDRLVTYDAALRPNTLEGTLKNSYTGEPIAGATVKAGDASATSDDSGHYVLENVPERTTVSFSADGYADLSQPIDKQIALDATLRPDVLKATLVDATTNKPIPNATILASPNVGSSDVAFTRIDNSNDGTFELDGLPEQGVIQVLAPGYKKAVIEIKAGSIEPTIKLEPFLAKALYVTAAVASRPDLLNEYLDMIDRTELNAIVIDLKSDLRDDLGLVYYDSQVPLVKELGTSRPYMDLAAILAETKKRGIYTIARIHIFSHDNALADARPDWAAKDRKTGEVFADYPGPNIRYAWLDPWNENVWDYNIQLSVEAAQMGFDEINYDYIRFPSLEFAADDKDRLQLSREGTPEEKFQNIANVLERSQRAIN
ncbi:MAG TPA: putative glycoside hydrolase, partial [Roseiflexaceae bacterium]|nr:putative glycoside hydrolase [Roseiflexaceae bacterium]